MQLRKGLNGFVCMTVEIPNLQPVMKTRLKIVDLENLVEESTILGFMSVESPIFLSLIFRFGIATPIIYSPIVLRAFKILRNASSFFRIEKTE